MKKGNIFCILVLMLLSLLVTAVPAMAETGIPAGAKAVTIKTQVNVRDKPSTSGKSLGRLNKGTSVKILKTTNATNGWYNVYVSGVTSSGYIREDCLGSSGGSSGGGDSGGGSTNLPEKVGSKQTGYVAISNGYLKVRDAPVSGKEVCRAEKDHTIYYYTTTKSGWYYVEYPDNGVIYKGYASSDYIKPGSGSSDKRFKCPQCGATPEITYSSEIFPKQIEYNHEYSGRPDMGVHTCDSVKTVTTRCYKCPNFDSGSHHTLEWETSQVKKVFFCGAVEIKDN